jgi:hypothetical protein
MSATISTYKIYSVRVLQEILLYLWIFLCGDFHFAPSYGVCISQLVRFACICNYVSNFNNRNLVIMENLLIPRILFS